MVCGGVTGNGGSNKVGQLTKQKHVQCINPIYRCSYENEVTPSRNGGPVVKFIRLSELLVYTEDDRHELIADNNEDTLSFHARNFDCKAVHSSSPNWRCVVRVTCTVSAA